MRSQGSVWADVTAHEPPLTLGSVFPSTAFALLVKSFHCDDMMTDLFLATLTKAKEDKKQGIPKVEQSPFSRFPI